MNAREMFKKLGYTNYKEYGNEAIIYYEPSENYGIVFDLVHKYIDFGDGCMSVDDLKAINKQCEELGWLDE